MWKATVGSGSSFRLGISFADVSLNEHKSAEMVCQSCVTRDLRGYATSQKSFDRRGHIMTQFLSPLQSAFYPDNLEFPRGDLACRFVVLMCCVQTALMAGEHPPEDRYGTFLGQ